VSEVGVIGRVTSVQSTTLRVALEVGAKGFTKVGPDGLHTVGVVNSYITVPAGAHRVVAIVTGVYISRQVDKYDQHALRSEDDQSAYELEAAVVGRFEGDVFKSGLTGYPPLHAPVRSATPREVKGIFLPRDVPALRLGRLPSLTSKMSISTRTFCSDITVPSWDRPDLASPAP
jgi:xanthosine utilization system XapX-like protein